MQFDSASNELAAQFSITDSDTNETIALFFSGTFSDIEKGKCFRLDIDDLSLNNITATAEDMESLGITASLSVDAEPGDIVTPTDCRYLLEMDQNALMSLFMNALQTPRPGVSCTLRSLKVNLNQKLLISWMAAQ